MVATPGRAKAKKDKKDKRKRKSKRKKSIGGDYELGDVVNPMLSAQDLANTLQLSSSALDPNDPSEGRDSMPDDDNTPDEEIHDLEDWSSEVKEKEVPPPAAAAHAKSSFGSIFGFGESSGDAEETKDAVGLDTYGGVEDDLENRGPSGWLHRENELSQDNPSESPWIKVFAVLQDRHLIYKVEKKPVPGENVVGDGFIEIEAKTSVKQAHIHKMGATTSTQLGQHCFTVKEPNDLENTTHAMHVSFSASSADEMNMWINAIIDATKGVVHQQPRETKMALNALSDEITAQNNSTMELPRKIGKLKKYAVGGLLGVKTIKQRWFRLDGGELRYYASEDMRPSKLKGTIILRGAKLIPTPDDPTQILLQLPKPKAEKVAKRLQMEAESPHLAKEWRDSLQETLLALLTSGSSASGGKKRTNLADVGESEEDKAKKKKAEEKDDDDDSGPALMGGGGWGGMGGGTSIPEKSVHIIMKCVKNHFLLKTIEDPMQIISKMNMITKLPGDLIISQGAPGDFFYVLETGAATVLVGSHKVGRIPPGASFGDLALLNTSARTATVKASQLCTLWTLDRQTFRDVLSKHERRKHREKMAFLRTVKLFEQISDYSLEKISDVMQFEVFEPKHKIFKQGEAGESFYMIQKGKVSISINTFTSSNEVARLGANKSFGELALINSAPRGATITAIDKTYCWTIDRGNFVALIGSIKQAADESIGFKVLKKVKLLEACNDKQLVSIARCLKAVEFAEGEEIITQGEDGDTFYVLASGEVDILVNSVNVAHLDDNAYFGEMSLLKNEKRSATVVATVDCVCLSLNRDDFNRLLGPIADDVRAEVERREAATQASTGSEMINAGFNALFGASPLNVKLSPKKKSGDAGAGQVSSNFFDLDMLDRVKVLGRGTFSTVYLVRHVGNDTFYAVKVMHKQTLVLQHQEKNVYTERDIMNSFDHPFVCDLYGSFQTASSLYMVTQFCPGGDLLELLQSHDVEHTRLGGLHVDDAAFYAANVLVMLSAFVDKDVAFRDLKPENLALDSSGFLRIFDFGAARVLIGEETTNTMVGTPEYLTPEQIMSKGHGKGVDYWALGVLLYELLTKKTPFEHANSAMIYQNIMESQDLLKIAFAKDFDKEAKDLILKLLVPNPHMRLGMLRNGPSDIWDHPFFSNLSEKKVGLKDLTPPHKPPDAEHSANSRIDLADIMIGSFDTDVVPKYTGSFAFKDF
jgi:cGMP-dependent protein kinase